jgi:hypothetical protein
MAEAEDKTKELLSKLEIGIKETLTSDRYIEFLKVQSQFHTYSSNNAMLIYLQRPDATRVAGYNSWKKFERHVKKGEHGISILAPSPYKYEQWVEKRDPKTKEPIKDPGGNVQKEKVTKDGLRFVKVTVFDVSQTEGKELPVICKELQGNSIQAQNIIKAIKQISEIPIIEEKITGGAKGYFSREKNIIALNEGMSFDQAAKTLVHEYAHSTVHKSPIFDRPTREVQAESIAYVVSNHFGLDTSAYTFEYLASWSSGRELPELKQSFDLIQKTSNDIINNMENVMAEEFAQQNSKLHTPVPVSHSTEPLPIQSVRDKIIVQYNQEFPAIKHISEKSAQVINAINSQRDKHLSIKGIRQAYTLAGKKLELGDPSSNEMQTFKVLKEVVDDLKNAQLVDKQAKAHEKSLVNPSKSKVMEMAQ